VPVSTEDYLAITQMFARYCWLVDEGDAEGWANLFTEDGELAGLTPVILKGREQLKSIPTGAFAGSQGKLRHMAGNMCCEYGDNRDVVHAKYYNMVTNWQDGGKFTCMAISKVVLVRHGAGWLIQRSDSEMFLG
jgi:ketosteroid isomerase-like protein